MTADGVRGRAGRPSPGLHGVLVTPFDDEEALDDDGLRAVIDLFAQAGSKGVLVLGVLGEADRLSDHERDRVTGVAVDHARERLAVTVGITHESTRVTAQRAREAERAGADAVMVSPPGASTAGPALLEHFKRVADTASIPIVLQDVPGVTGVRLPVPFLAEILSSVPAVRTVKLEEPPTAAKMARLLDAVPDAEVFGGLGGAYALAELEAGSLGLMTGFAFPELLAEVVSAFRRGDSDAARVAYDRALPLIAFEAQPAIGVPLRKEILRRRGVIAHATVRAPAPSLDPATLAELDRLLAASPTG